MVPARAFAPCVQIGLIGFLTLVDLFSAQAIAPTLARTYGVAPSVMGAAVNASTIGMVIAGLAVALVGHRLPRRGGIWMSLALLAVPTALLAHASDLATFTALRIVQGLFISAAFTLTVAGLSERRSGSPLILAAYVTGNVAANLGGRLAASAVASTAGVAINFYAFAALNLAGALLVFVGLKPGVAGAEDAERHRAAARIHVPVRNARLVASFGVGVLALFAFLGAFTYANVTLGAPPSSWRATVLGLVYFLVLPTVVTTPLAGRVVDWLGPRPTVLASLGLALAGAPLLAGPVVAALVGLVLVGLGACFAQATASGLAGRAARTDRASADGIYLASYHLGGLTGAAIIGQIYDRFGWPPAMGVVGGSLMAAAGLAASLRPATAGSRLIPAAAA